MISRQRHVAIAGTLAREVSVTIDWRLGLPVVRCPRAVLREPRLADAAALSRHFSSASVCRFISTPPSSPEDFERFISRVQHERRSGRHVCYVIVPDGLDESVGLIQIREADGGFGTAEWGFALSEAHWGTGLFMACAPRALDFAFRVMNVHRIEARTSTSNGRANGALKKLGGVPEGILRRSFANDTIRSDQVLWSFIANDWLATHPESLSDLGGQVVQAPESAPAGPHRDQPSWRRGLPTLQGPGLFLRELVLSDAPLLTALFADSDVRRYIPPPPVTVEDFERFIEWTGSSGATARSCVLAWCRRTRPTPLACCSCTNWNRRSARPSGDLSWAGRGGGDGCSRGLPAP